MNTVIKVSLFKEYTIWDEDGRQMTFLENDDFWLYKSKESADRKVRELELLYGDESPFGDCRHIIRKEVCFVWD